ncbi:MAG: hypothetical protein HY321_01055 [Armatimonadetes bacterium]|nr:hypothetical protein [Armatimonadota bacterium]
MRTLITCVRRTGWLSVCQGAIVTGLCAGSAVAAEAPAPAPSASNPTVLYIGSSCIGNQVPMMLSQLAAATTPPITIHGRLYLRGAHGLPRHWERPSQPAKMGNLLSYIRYPDLPRPGLTARTLATWGGERRADFGILDAYGQQYDEDELYFWIRLYRQALVKRGVKPIIYLCHIGGPGFTVNFLYPFKSEAEGLAKLEKANAACVRVAAELDLEVAPSHLACYKVKRARPDLPLDLVGSPDRDHAGQRGYYLEACTIYSVLFNRSPEGLPVRTIYMKPPDPNLNETVGAGQVTLAEDEARFLQRTAWESVQEFRQMVAEHKAALAAGRAQPLAPTVKPRILVIGAPFDDTIRDASKKLVTGFRSALQERVKRQTGMDVVFAPGGPCAAGEALIELDDCLGDQKWALVAFGWGARELAQQMPPAEYEKNLRALLAKLEQNGSPLCWTGFLPVTPQKPPDLTMREMELDTLTNVSVGRDAGPLMAVAERVLQEHGLALDPAYEENVADFFTPGGRPAERVLTKADWVQLAGWLAESLGRRMSAVPSSPPRAE